MYRPRLPIERLPAPHLFHLMWQMFELRLAQVTDGKYVTDADDFLKKFTDLDPAQWRRWANGRSFMKSDTYVQFVESLYPTVSERLMLDNKYREYQFGVRAASRTKRTDDPRRRLSDYEHDFIESYLFEKGIAFTDLRDRKVFGRVAKELLDYRTREGDLLLGVHAGEVMALLVLNGTIPAAGPSERDRQLAVIMYYSALNADHEDNEPAHKQLMKQMKTQFGPLRRDPFVRYMEISFPLIFYGQFDRIWKPMNSKSRPNLQELVRGYENALAYAAAFDGSDNAIQDFGITNLVSSADYNLQRTKAFVDDIDRRRLIAELETIDQRDLDAGSPVHMRMHNILGLADAYIRGGSFGRAEEILSDLIETATPEKRFSRFQLGRAHYKRALTAWLSISDMPPSVREKRLSVAIDDLETARKIYKAAGNEKLEADAMERILAIRGLLRRG
jgi:hypothetical protein